MAEQVNTQVQAGQAYKLDPNMRLDQKKDGSLAWYSPKEGAFQVVGLPWFQQEQIYRRLPVAPEWPIRPEVDELANCTAGGQVRFRTDSTKLSVRVKLAGAANMYHMPSTGQCGFDCYIGEPEQMKYAGTTRYDIALTEYEWIIFDWPELSPESRMITLNFPLYQGVEELEIGLLPGAVLEAPTPYADNRKIIIYGTSITQGGCAMRPGMAYPNIISRWMNYEIYNQGYSGNGRGDPEMARLLADIDNPAMLVLDYEANSVSVEYYSQTLPEFVSIYREKHPTVPILIISKINYCYNHFQPSVVELNDIRRRLASELVEQRRAAGDRHIHFLDGAGLLGEDYEECTVDGSHPTDLGFWRMAERIAPVIRGLL
ncbi:SGNH/GDSL hydrolase family protein [Paenibacillus koleovorans]|uniref:SGNH/GDSL hydrolase family protein n=1 Tax=Paenibacillus koleovorans TaxID=121608 RepID=UPI000FD8CC82|nr:SGNH/GDSL hydrolase family protein [Paenibacillus koleovorans]